MVYIHPFMDGNGRAHRFLFHNVLAQREYAPPGTLFPLSAWLLNHRRDYIGCMTDTCQGILGTADLQRLPDGRLKVRNDIKAGFQFPDLTLEALSLCRFVEASVREELEPNIEFLKHFDEALHGLEVLVEWPYSRLVLFIKLCVQNNGRLSRRKRNLEVFRHLSTPLLDQLERCVQSAYNLSTDQTGPNEPSVVTESPSLPPHTW